ncbi:MAG: PaaI family thioesterase [Gammaproteobacteria bacterium]
MVAESIAIQDCYGDPYSHCFGCGRNNPQGHQLKSYWHGDETAARFTPPEHYTGGVPDHVYGGLIASLFDCHGTASAAAFNQRDKGGHLEEPETLERCVTAKLEVEFLSPTPMGKELVLRGKLVDIEGRKVSVSMTLEADGLTRAQANMLAIVLPVA